MHSVLLLYRTAVFADAPDVAGSATVVAPGTAATSECGDAVGCVDGDVVGTVVDGAELPAGVGNFGAEGGGRAKGKRQRATDLETWRRVLR